MKENNPKTPSKHSFKKEVRTSAEDREPWGLAEVQGNPAMQWTSITRTRRYRRTSWAYNRNLPDWGNTRSSNFPRILRNYSKKIQMRLSTTSSRWWLNGILRVWVTKKTMEFSNGITSRILDPPLQRTIQARMKHVRTAKNLTTHENNVGWENLTKTSRTRSRHYYRVWRKSTKIKKRSYNKEDSNLIKESDEINLTYLPRHDNWGKQNRRPDEYWQISSGGETKAKKVHVRGHNLVISKTGGDYQHPRLLKTKSMKKRSRLWRPTINLWLRSRIRSTKQYEDGSHEEPQEGNYDHGHIDENEMIDTINRLKKETIPTVNNIRTMMQVNTNTIKMIDKKSTRSTRSRTRSTRSRTWSTRSRSTWSTWSTRSR